MSSAGSGEGDGADQLSTAEIAHARTARLDVDRDADDDLRHAALKAEVQGRLLGVAVDAARIGRYAILKLLGEGGMGTVFAAYDDQLDRRVALKLLKTADGSDARLRMLREAQALARLSHPNVVPVFEVGEHGEQLFVAMEYVKGVTMKRWRDDGEHTWREVLEKYAQAGRGLAAAHAAGLVHRDFKPHNAVVGDDGRVRVLDFGLAAKQGALDITAHGSLMLPSPRHDALDSPLTESGAIMGTPAYMPPEQFMGGEVDPRGDQFSFCVSLWEALYRARPFEGSNATELFTRIAQGKLVEPRVTDVPAAIRPILQRGLRPDAAERWPDMAALLSALDGWELRARTRRRVAGVAAVSVVAACLFGWRQYDQAQRLAACTEAGESIAEAWNDTTRQAVRQGVLATGVSYAPVTADNVMPWLDAQADAWREARTQVCVDTNIHRTWTADLHDRALWCLDERRLQLEAVVEALTHADARIVQKSVSVASVLARVENCRDSAMLARLTAPPSESREPIRAVRSEIYRAFALSEPLAGLEAARAARHKAEVLAWPPLLASAELVLGSRLTESGAVEEAERVLEDAYFRAEAAGAHEISASASDGLVFLVGYQLARLDDGLRWWRLAELALSSLGDDGQTTRTAAHLSALASAYAANGDPTKAKPLHARALAIFENVLGRRHPHVAVSLMNLANAHAALGEFTEARALLERSVSILETAFGPGHPSLAKGLTNLGNVYNGLGRDADAKVAYERALVISEAALGPEHPDVASLLENLGDHHTRLAEYAEAMALLERSLGVRERALGVDHPDVARSLESLASVLLHTGDYAKAIVLGERALATAEKALGHAHPDLSGALIVLAQAALATDRPFDAITLAERALALGGDGGVRGRAAAEALYALARALWDAPQDRGRDRDRAIVVGRQARDGFREWGEGSNDRVVEVERWLNERDPVHSPPK